MSDAGWGTAVHTALHRRITALKRAFPAAFADLFSELTVDRNRLDSEQTNGPAYGQSGTSRLDVVQKVNADTYCAMDIKTGTSGLTPRRILEILSKLPEGVTIYVMEVRPFE